jgi:hypothetical protein
MAGASVATDRQARLLECGSTRTAGQSRFAAALEHWARSPKTAHRAHSFFVGSRAPKAPEHSRAFLWGSITSGTKHRLPPFWASA